MPETAFAPAWRQLHTRHIQRPHGTSPFATIRRYIVCPTTGRAFLTTALHFSTQHLAAGRDFRWPFPAKVIYARAIYSSVSPQSLASQQHPNARLHDLFIAVFRHKNVSIGDPGSRCEHVALDSENGLGQLHLITSHYLDFPEAQVARPKWQAMALSPSFFSTYWASFNARQYRGGLKVGTRPTDPVALGWFHARTYTHMSYMTMRRAYLCNRDEHAWSDLRHNADTNITITVTGHSEWVRASCSIMIGSWLAGSWVPKAQNHQCHDSHSSPSIIIHASML